MKTNPKTEIIRTASAEVHIEKLAAGPFRIRAFLRCEADNGGTMLRDVIMRLFPASQHDDARAAAHHFLACLYLPTCTEAAARRGSLLSPSTLAA